MEATVELEVRPLTTAVGALVEGVDLRRPLSPQLAGSIRQALLDHGALFFQGQELSAGEMRTFLGFFGELFVEPYADGGWRERNDPVGASDLAPTKPSTAVWHADSTYLAEPPMATALRAVRLPPVGGDTCWASMYAAYEALSEPLRRMLDGLTAVHSMHPTVQREPLLKESFAQAARRYGEECAQPVVRVHPETGRKALYVNECSTTRIVELSQAESAKVLELLFAHIRSPDFAVRWRWSPNDLAFWDNRSVQHYAVPDYRGERVMQRMEIAGDRPRGP